MRIKHFTLMLMAVLFSVAGFAKVQKSMPAEKRVAFNREAKAALKQNKQTPVFAMNSQATPVRPATIVSGPKAASVVTPPEDGEVEYFTLSGTNSRGGNVSRTVQVVWDGDDDVYISGLSYFLPYAFVKGTFKDDETVIFEKGQYMGTLDGMDVFFGANFKDDFVDAVATFDEVANAFIFNDKVVDNGNDRKLDVLAYWEPELTIAPAEGPGESIVEIPNDMEVITYAYTAVDYFSGHATVSGNMNVGFYGSDMYVQGMSTDFPEAWIKGSFVNDTTIVFPAPQLLDESRGVYFASSDLDTYVDEYILYYDKESGAYYEGEYFPMITSDLTSFSLWQFYYGYVITPITEQEATPAASFVSAMAYMPDGDYLEFSLAKVDEDGFGLVPEKLSYKLWYATEEGDTLEATFLKDEYTTLTEDMKEIPATYIDGSDFQEGKLRMNFADYPTWTGLGIQGIYYGGGERHESEVAWYSPTWPQTITLPDGLTVTEHNLKGQTNRGANVERTVGLALDGNDMYIRGIGSMDADAWVKGTKNADGDYVFPKGQEIGTYYDEDRLFLLGYDDEIEVTDFVMSVDAANNQYVFKTDFVENADYTDKTYYVQWVNAGTTIEMGEAQPEVLEPVVIPDGLVTEVYSFTATDYFDTQSAGQPVIVAKNVLVGFDGEDVYIQGISDALPEAWMKGTLDGDKMTIPAGQYVGKSGTYDLWTIGFIDGTGVSNYTMEYDEETSSLTNKSSVEYFGTTSVKGSSRNLSDFFYAITIKKLTEKVATPATPSISTIAFTYAGDEVEFNVPAVDVDGDGLVTEKLSYKLYYDEGDGEAKEVTFTTDLYEYLTEDMTVIPYGFIDASEEHPNGWDFYSSAVYLNMEHSSWTRVGIQSIYTGGGETMTSEIGWYTITFPQTIELPEGAEVATYNFKGEYITDEGNEAFSRQAQVAFVDNDVYIQGVGESDPEAWIKGTKSEDGNTYTFGKGQFLGYYATQSGSVYPLYLMGYSSTFGAIDVKMSYDAETNTFTTMTEVVENANYIDNLYYLNRIAAGALIQPIQDVAAVPATPSADHMRFTAYGDVIEFAIPTTDVDGAPLLTDKLSYKLYYDEGDGVAHEITFTTEFYEKIEAEMTEIPYGFTDNYDIYDGEVYLNMDAYYDYAWKRIGIQSIYAGGGETNASEIGWYDVTYPEVVAAPEGAEIKDYGFFGTSYYNRVQHEFTKGGMKVAMVGDDVYVQGIGSVDADKWIRGTKGEDNVYTFSLGQYLGMDSYEYEGATYYDLLFLVGADPSTGDAAPLQMSYDPETGIFTTLNYMAENADYTDKLYYNVLYLPGAQLVPTDGPDAISLVEAETEGDVVRYNVAGQRVGKNYKGIVVENGKKVLRK